MGICGILAYRSILNGNAPVKVPNLRNVELTAPYLHDGTVTTLDEAVRIMGVYLSGMDIPKGDRDLIVGFLRTLTGEWNGKPLAGEAVKN